MTDSIFHPVRSHAAGVLSRRTLLSAGAMGLLGLGSRLCASESAVQAIAPRAKSVIFLFQFGGPSQLDMFDMKPHAPDAYRSPHAAIETRLPGVVINERLPRMAQVMDKVTLVRSMRHSMKNHNSASYYALTGHAPPADDIRLRDSQELYPAYGSVVDRLATGSRELPAFVAYPHVLRDGEVTPGQHASFLGKSHDPFLVLSDPNGADFTLPELALPASITPDRLANRRAVQKLVDDQLRLAERFAVARGLEDHFERALEMVSSDRVRRAFDLAAEPQTVRDAYGRTTYGQGCLLARRLVESGVKFVNVYFSDSIGGQSSSGGGWDTHGFNNTRMYPIIEALHLPLTDQTLPTLLTDLDERGLLDTTLVVWTGEFGRTPKINSASSRDHWPQCYTVLLAGGGVKRGHVFGASDKYAAMPARDPVTPDDLAATIYHLMGIDPATEVRDVAGRPLPIAAGVPIQGVIA